MWTIFLVKQGIIFQSFRLKKTKVGLESDFVYERELWNQDVESETGESG